MVLEQIANLSVVQTTSGFESPSLHQIAHSTSAVFFNHEVNHEDEVEHTRSD